MERYVVNANVTDDDVLLGRGDHSVRHKGNVRFRQVILHYQDMYLSANRNTVKNKIARMVIDTITSRNGRFLRKANAVDIEQFNIPPQSNSWIPVNTNEASLMKKIKQAFRDLREDDDDDKKKSNGNNDSDDEIMPSRAAAAADAVAVRSLEGVGGVGVGMAAGTGRETLSAAAAAGVAASASDLNALPSIIDRRIENSALSSPSTLSLLQQHNPRDLASATLSLHPQDALGFTGSSALSASAAETSVLRMRLRILELRRQEQELAAAILRQEQQRQDELLLARHLNAGGGGLSRLDLLLLQQQRRQAGSSPLLDAGSSLPGLSGAASVSSMQLNDILQRRAAAQLDGGSSSLTQPTRSRPLPEDLSAAVVTSGSHKRQKLSRTP